MTNAQTGMFFILSAIVMAMGIAGGVEQCKDLISYDGLYLAAFALVALGLGALGNSYIKEA